MLYKAILFRNCSYIVVSFMHMLSILLKYKFGSLTNSSSILCAACPVNFEFQNYTVITSQCKGPRYLPKPCCDSFKEFACPYSEELNDLSNNCASTMFSYINVYGKYPPGLFSSFCREGKEGLDCTEYFKEDSANDASGVHNIGNRFQLIMLTAACLVALFQML